MKVNKKGIFFTFAAIVLSIIIISSFNVYTGYRLKDKMEVIEVRINTMNSFIIDLENDIENAIFISGFRSLLSLEDYLMDHDVFFGGVGAPSLSVAFSDAFLKGTIDFDGLPEKIGLMKNNTFINWTTRIKEQTNKTDITVDFTVNSVTITQSEPWKVDITINLDINVKDKKNTASWTINDKDYIKQINITTRGSNTKFVDPLYLVNTNGVANNTIKETIYSSWPADLSLHINNHYYREHSDAPSYLDRFQNDNSGSYGIESMVTDVLQDESIIVDTSKSAVDYLYFGTSPIPCDVAEIGDPDFVLDDPTHTGYYGATCV